MLGEPGRDGTQAGAAFSERDIALIAHAHDLPPGPRRDNARKVVAWLLGVSATALLIAAAWRFWPSAAPTDTPPQATELDPGVDP